MKNKILVKLSSCFLFLAVGFLMIFSPLVSKSQNSSAGSLIGTVWDTNKYPRQKSNNDKSITTIVYFLGFYNQGKAKVGIIEDKSAGYTEKYEDDYVILNDGTTDHRNVRKVIRTLPSVNNQQWEGTYQIKGKLVYLDFPSFTINATVTATSIEGVLTHKDTNKDEPVLFTKTASVNNLSDTNKPINPNDLSVSNKDIINDKHQTAEMLSARATDLLNQKKYREAINILNNIFEIELDTKEYVIRAYVFRAVCKLSLQDYKGTIEDSSRAIQLSTPLKIYYDEQNKKKAIANTLLPDTSSKNPFEAALKANLEAVSEESEESAANYGLNMGYYFRAIAKSKLGDKSGACEDSRKPNGSIRKEPNEFCN